MMRSTRTAGSRLRERAQHMTPGEGHPVGRASLQVLERRRSRRLLRTSAVCALFPPLGRASSAPRAIQFAAACARDPAAATRSWFRRIHTRASECAEARALSPTPSAVRRPRLRSGGYPAGARGQAGEVRKPNPTAERRRRCTRGYSHPRQDAAGDGQADAEGQWGDRAGCRDSGAVNNVGIRYPRISCETRGDSAGGFQRADAGSRCLL